MATALSFPRDEDAPTSVLSQDFTPISRVAPTMSEAGFQRLATFLQARLGIQLRASKKGMLESRLLRRMYALGLADFDAYITYFFSPEGQTQELSHVIDLATTHHTFFFREPEHFDALADQLVPETLARTPTIRAWSAACSTGEEAYTIAMVLAECATRSRFDFSVLGTDVSTKVLATARRGVYDEAALDSVPPHFVPRYFLRSKQRELRQIRVAPELRSTLAWSPLNLMEDYRLEHRVDIAFVRNLTIYFDQAGTQRLLEKVCSQLVPQGYLLLSLTESIEGLRLPLVSIGRSIYRRLP